MYQGIFGAAWGLSYFIGPLAGGWVYDYWGSNALWVGCLILGFVVALLIHFIVLSSVMDELAMIVLTIPIIFPLVIELDLYGLPTTEKAIWFGILVLSVAEIGLIAPPVGLNVYVVNSLAPDVPMLETYKGVAAFLVADVVRVALVLAFPFLSLWLVRLIW